MEEVTDFRLFRDYYEKLLPWKVHLLEKSFHVQIQDLSF